MAGSVKLLTSAGGGVILDTATTTATDVTVKVPVTGVNNGTLACTDANGNLGLGVTPSAWSGFKALQIARSSFTGAAADTYLNHNWYWSGTADTYIANDFATRYRQNSGQHIWYTAPSGTAGNAISFTQAMTLDASGNLLVGTTDNSTNQQGVAWNINSGGSFGRIGHANGTASGGAYLAFQYNGGVIGSITQNGTTATAYNTSSDYRLKENIKPMQNALGVVAQLNPVTYTWKADGSDGQGFIAHELQAVVPDCVTGEKDAVDAEGNPVYQGIDTSFLVATLTKAIQELSAKNDALEARIAALEAK